MAWISILFALKIFFFKIEVDGEFAVRQVADDYRWLAIGVGKERPA